MNYAKAVGIFGQGEWGECRMDHVMDLEQETPKSEREQRFTAERDVTLAWYSRQLRSGGGFREVAVDIQMELNRANARVKRLRKILKEVRGGGMERGDGNGE